MHAPCIPEQTSMSALHILAADQKQRIPTVNRQKIQSTVSPCMSPPTRRLRATNVFLVWHSCVLVWCRLIDRGHTGVRLACRSCHHGFCPCATLWRECIEPDGWDITHVISGFGIRGEPMVNHLGNHSRLLINVDRRGRIRSGVPPTSNARAARSGPSQA